MAYTLYDYLPSGNGYKVRLVCKKLGLAYRLVECDILRGETRTAEFLAKNPNGRIPLLEVPGRGFLAESHAIVSFLAEGSTLVPKDSWARALMWHWLCFEQYNLEPNVAVVRFWRHCLNKTPQELGEKLVEKTAKGYEALGVLEKGLTGRRYLVGDALTLADICLYAYTHVAPQGGFSFEAYPAIREWIVRVAAEPRHAPITDP